jgi:hypothetical protein
VPIITIAFDYENKLVVIFDAFTITNDFEKDSFYLESLYTNIKGKVPAYSYTR